MAAALFDELPKREVKQPKFGNYEEYLANNAPTHEQLEEQRENAAEPSAAKVPEAGKTNIDVLVDD